MAAREPFPVPDARGELCALSFLCGRIAAKRVPGFPEVEPEEVERARRRGAIRALLSEAESALSLKGFAVRRFSG